METIFPIENEKYICFLHDQVLETYFRDNNSTHLMLPDGAYLPAQALGEEPRLNVQSWLMHHPHGDFYESSAQEL